MPILSEFHNHNHGETSTFTLPRKIEAPLFKIDPKNQQRRKIWDISPNLHCSIIGTCLTATELRQFLGKMGEPDAKTASDHSLHSRGVLAAGRQDIAGKQLNKTLDRRHETLVKRFSKVATLDEIRKLWAEALEEGEVPGAYWAVMTHPATDKPLLQEVFGEVHMLSHLVGSANRLDIARLRKLQTELDERDEKIVRQEARLQSGADERSALLRRIDEMEQTIIRLAARNDTKVEHADETSILRSALERLDTEKARSESLTARLQATEDKCKAAEKRAAAMSEQIAELRFELEAVDTMLNVETADGSPSVLSSRSLLYVGGRRGLFDRLRVLAEQRGYALFLHDGGVEDNLSLLPGLVSQASAALFPVDCIGGGARQASVSGRAEKVRSLENGEPRQLYCRCFHRRGFGQRIGSGHASAEGEGKSLCARIKKLDFKFPV
ncbi:hypothetical protein [Phyllobacterium myrsinacearum]|uniref:DUF2325 domain-containing protein n=1 Tax=Phyllobacterium myrsinacearum TaxID=28101 RepID=A0A839EPD8_9HYPH|nr:hypothetical protein [Phyllobacterium myrsinacearum]MBA8878337.1 hypothetical protein [Phyllobacterium myrsinacearum]